MFLDNHNFLECSGCTACESVCSKKAISFSEVHNGFYYPKIDPTKCVGCNMCRKVCVFNNKIYDTEENTIYYGWVRDETIRLDSTSGGGFAALVINFINMHINDKRSVYGAAWIDIDKVKHVCITEIEELKKIQRSKYIQSDIHGLFNEIKTKLANDEWVMFSGTPCQVAALKSYIGEKEGSRLITIDLICNGLSSPIVFRDYIKFLNRKYPKLVEYSFRNKNLEKRSQKFVGYLYENGTTKYREDDLFYIAYQLRLLHRESCFNCPYSEQPHDADITLGDFWHIEDILPELKEERIKGISLVMCNTHKGQRFINNLEGIQLTKTNIIPKAQPLSIKMRDKGMDSFFDSYNPDMIGFQLKRYIGFKRFISCKYYNFYKNYCKVKRAISRGIKHG